MLIEFRVENHRSIRDEQVLSMVEGRGDSADDPRPRKVAGYPERLLPAAALYGANASGKSNVLEAVRFMRDAVLLSHRAWPPDEGVPRDPFAWGPKRAEPSLFEIVWLLDGVRYQYGFTASDERFLEEWLYAWPRSRKQVWFERDGDLFQFSEHLKGENKILAGVTRPNALFLSAATQFGHTQLREVYNIANKLNFINSYFDNKKYNYNFDLNINDLMSVVERNSRSLGGSQSLSIRKQLAERTLEEFRRFLKNADLGVLDFRVRKNNAIGVNPSLSVPYRFDLKHRCGTGDVWLPLEEESKGTQTLFRIALPVIDSIWSGEALFIDELESSLHPALAREIVRRFNDPEANPRNAQLIFTTHDTNLLGTTVGPPPLRRDQVWLTEKDSDGATVLYPLTDFKPRKDENLERGYLQGRYGAIPFLGDFVSLGGTSE